MMLVQTRIWQMLHESLPHGMRNHLHPSLLLPLLSLHHDNCCFVSLFRYLLRHSLSVIVLWSRDGMMYEYMSHCMILFFWYESESGLRPVFFLASISPCKSYFMELFSHTLIYLDEHSVNFITACVAITSLYKYTDHVFHSLYMTFYNYDIESVT